METSKNLNKSTFSGGAPDFLSLAENMLFDLNKRSKEIIWKRFGLAGGKGETLEKIGGDYGITRERVRQIISEVMRIIAVQSDQEDFLKAERKIIFTIDRNNGIIKESDIVEKFNSDGQKEANAIRFFASCSKNIFEVEEKGVLGKSWVTSMEVFERVRSILIEAEKIVQKEKKLLSDQEIFERISGSFPELRRDETLNFLKVSLKIKKNNFGKWGLSDWMEVSPKGTKEKVYLILKEKKTPLHFTEIASLIDKFKLGKRKAHPQTVHNELIKDDRFVLIGRGIYALREWGYSKGTIKDVIRVILEKNKRALSKDEIIDMVLRKRHVKKTTIMINLNNRKFFEKKGEFYSVKK